MGQELSHYIYQQSFPTPRKGCWLEIVSYTWEPGITTQIYKKVFFCLKLNKKSFGTSVSIAGVISRLAMTVVATISTVIAKLSSSPVQVQSSWS